MSKKVFISRDLDGDSPFRRMLEDRGWAVVGESLISFRPLSFAWPVAGDWVFFSSSRGITFFLAGLPEGQMPAGLRLAVMGPGTEKTLNAAGYTADFTGNGDPESVAHAFASVAGGKKVLFPQASHSRRSVQRWTEGKLQAVDLIVYDNEMKNEAVIPQCDAYVLTSPLNAQAFHRATSGDRTGQAVVAIGAPTEAALREMGYADIRTAVRPRPEDLAQTVLQLFQP